MVKFTSRRPNSCQLACSCAFVGFLGFQQIFEYNNFLKSMCNHLCWITNRYMHMSLMIAMQSQASRRRASIASISKITVRQTSSSPASVQRTVSDLHVLFAGPTCIILRYDMLSLQHVREM